MDESSRLSRELDVRAADDKLVLSGSRWFEFRKPSLQIWGKALRKSSLQISGANFSASHLFFPGRTSPQAVFCRCLVEICMAQASALISMSQISGSGCEKLNTCNRHEGMAPHKCTTSRDSSLPCRARANPTLVRSQS